MKKLALVLLLTSCHFFSLFAQRKMAITPRFLSVAVGKYDFVNKETNTHRINTYSTTIGAGWEYKISKKIQLNPNLELGVRTSESAFNGSGADGYRFFMRTPITVQYLFSSKFKVGMGVYFQKDFYSEDEVTGRKNCHMSELQLVNSSFLGLTGNMGYSISRHSRVGLQVFYIPTVKVSEHSFMGGEPFRHQSFQLNYSYILN